MGKMRIVISREGIKIVDLELELAKKFDIEKSDRRAHRKVSRKKKTLRDHRA